MGAGGEIYAVLPSMASHVTAFMVAEDATQTRGESQAARNSGGGSPEGGRPNLKRDIAHRLGGF